MKDTIHREFSSIVEWQTNSEKGVQVCWQTCKKWARWALEWGRIQQNPHHIPPSEGLQRL